MLNIDYCILYKDLYERIGAEHNLGSTFSASTIIHEILGVLKQFLYEPTYGIENEIFTILVSLGLIKEQMIDNTTYFYLTPPRRC